MDRRAHRRRGGWGGRQYCWRPPIEVPKRDNRSYAHLGVVGTETTASYMLPAALAGGEAARCCFAKMRRLLRAGVAACCAPLVFSAHRSAGSSSSLHFNPWWNVASYVSIDTLAREPKQSHVCQPSNLNESPNDFRMSKRGPIDMTCRDRIRSEALLFLSRFASGRRSITA